MTETKRPRVAAIGLGDTQVASIAHLCGSLRRAAFVADYLHSYSWAETDVVVASGAHEETIAASVHLITIGDAWFDWPDTYRLFVGGTLTRHRMRSSTQNTERELIVPPACPDLYKLLADGLSK